MSKIIKEILILSLVVIVVFLIRFNASSKVDKVEYAPKELIKGTWDAKAILDPKGMPRCTPMSIEVDKKENIFIVDAAKAEIKKFDKSGKLLYSSIYSGLEGNINEIQVDSKCNIYLQDGECGSPCKILKFNKDKKLLFNIEEKEEGKNYNASIGNFDIDTKGNLYILYHFLEGDRKDSIYKYNKDGILSQRLECMRSVFDLFTEPEGNWVYAEFSASEGNENQICKINIQTKSIDEPIFTFKKLPYGESFGIIGVDSKGAIYLRRNIVLKSIKRKQTMPDGKSYDVCDIIETKTIVQKLINEKVHNIFEIIMKKKEDKEKAYFNAKVTPDGEVYIVLAYLDNKYQVIKLEKVSKKTP